MEDICYCIRMKRSLLGGETEKNLKMLVFSAACKAFKMFFFFFQFRAMFHISLSDSINVKLYLQTCQKVPLGEDNYLK